MTSNLLSSFYSCLNYLVCHVTTADINQGGKCRLLKMFPLSSTRLHYFQVFLMGSFTPWEVRSHDSHRRVFGHGCAGSQDEMSGAQRKCLLSFSWKCIADCCPPELLNGCFVQICALLTAFDFLYSTGLNVGSWGRTSFHGSFYSEALKFE